MAEPALITLKILLPFGVFVEAKDVSSLTVETTVGSYGFLPHRLDCVAALNPGILVYETSGDAETFLAIDQGVLVKVGLEILISVRNAIGGKDLGQLREAVNQEFLAFSEQQERVRYVMEKIESGFIQRLKELENG